MLKTRTLETTLCATCKRSVALAQLNSVTFKVEPTSAVVGGAIVLELHKCGKGPHPVDPLPEVKEPKRRGTVF